MQRIINNIFQSKAPLMVVLRSILVALVILMGMARLRITLMLLVSPATYHERDILVEYLMAKAINSGVNPYLPLDILAEMYVDKVSFFTHPSPHPPFIAILAIPFTWLSFDKAIIGWFMIEMLCLIAISCMITILLKGRVDWVRAIFILFLLLAWYPVMVDLIFGQLTILLTTLLLAALLAVRKNKKILGGVLIGLSIAIKMFTWPMLVYFALKKDWKSLISSCLTAAGLNLIALIVIGINPYMDYYLRVLMQVSEIYHSFLKNYSIWSIGYRLFEGSSPIGADYISAPPLISLPKLAPLVSAGLAVSFLFLGMIWAIRSKNVAISYSILLCVIVAISPISWDHYYIIIVICLAVLWLDFTKYSISTLSMTIFLIIIIMLFFINDQIDTIMILLNGGADILQTTGNQITFISSMLEILPILELLILTILLWRRGISKPQANDKTIELA